MKIDDLPGTKPKVDAFAYRPTRDVLRIDDIVGTRSKPRLRTRQKSVGFNAEDYRDVTH